MDSARVRAPGRRNFSLRRATRVKVVVCDDQGEPLPGGVLLRRPVDAEHTTEIPCDRDGSAEIDWNTFDHLGARVGEFGATMRRRSPPKDGGPIRIRVYRMWRVGGTVVDKEGAAVPGAWLHLLHEGPGARRIRSGPDGSFLFDGVMDNGRIDLRAWTADSAEHRRSVVRGDREVRIVLHAPITLTGHVLDPDGRPAVAAEIELECSMGYFEARTNDAGEFAIEGLDPTFVVSQIEAKDADGAQRILRRGPFPLSDQVELRFPPMETSWLVMQVVDGAGDPLAEVTCRAEQRAKTDASGRVVIRSSRPAGEEVEVRLHSFGLRSWRRTVRTAATREGPPVLVHAPGEREVRFLVVDLTGCEIPGARVEFILSTGGSGPPRETPVDLALQEGQSYNVRAGARGYASIKRAIYISEATKELKFVLQPSARVRGRTSPAFAISVNGDWNLHQVGKDGSFDLEVPAGELTLTAWDEARNPTAHVRMRIRPGETIDIGELPAALPTELAGIVVDEAGTPLPGVSLVLRTSITDRMHWTENTREDGAFTFQASTAGEWILIAAKEGRAAAVRVMEGGTAPGDLRLTCPRDEAVLRVRVSGRGARGRQTHHLRFPRSRVLLKWPFRDRRNEGDDRILEYRGLASGEITFILTLHPASGAETYVVERSVSLTAGKTTEIEIRVP